MKLTFKKISAMFSSLVLIGATAGLAAGANYPEPFISGGTANVAIVYGTGSGVATSDAIEAGNIQTDLQGRVGTSSSGSSASG